MLALEIGILWAPTPLPQFFHLFKQWTQKYIHLLPRILRTQNDKGKEYKSLFQTLVGWQIVRHDESWQTRIQTTGLAVRLETIHWEAMVDTPGVPSKFWIKAVQGLPSFCINRMRHNIRVFTITFPFLVPPHLFCYFLDRYNRLSLGVIGM
jgi:hypothetical protein